MVRDAGPTGLGELFDTWQAAIESRDLAGLPLAVCECLEAPLDADSMPDADVAIRLAILVCAASGFVHQAWRIAWAAGMTPEFLALDLALGVRRGDERQERRWRQGRRGHC
jgi:hypothetical protein